MTPGKHDCMIIESTVIIIMSVIVNDIIYHWYTQKESIIIEDVRCFFLIYGEKKRPI